MFGASYFKNRVIVLKQLSQGGHLLRIPILSPDTSLDALVLLDTKLDALPFSLVVDLPYTTLDALPFSLVVDSSHSFVQQKSFLFEL